MPPGLPRRHLCAHTGGVGGADPLRHAQDPGVGERHGDGRPDPAPPDPLCAGSRNTILFAGFQASGTRGAAMVAGAREVKIFGQLVPVKAEVRNMDMFSAHADAGEIETWLRGFRRPPRQTFITHGEPAAADALKRRIEENLGWTCPPGPGVRVGLTTGA